MKLILGHYAGPYTGTLKWIGPFSEPYCRPCSGSITGPRLSAKSIDFSLVYAYLLTIKE